jgi:hypothetical protein
MFAAVTSARQEAVWSTVIVLASAVVAVVSARPHAGGWNDGSRLATVECLVDYHTLAVDRSIFVQVPENGGPYPAAPADNAELLQRGTADKLFIDGKFYSDKSPVPALLLAALYQILQWTIGLRARIQPELFCYLMNLLSSGLAYVASVWCVFAIGRPLRLSLGARLLLTASFALATVAVVYVQHVNNHSLLLGVAAALMLALAHAATEANVGQVPWRRMLIIGCLAGLGYAIDLGAGPMLLVCTFVWVAWRCRRLTALATFVAAALPWICLHHVVNFAVGGTFGPANANPEFFRWEGCPFTPEIMTGAWNHPGVGKFVLYAASLLFGKHGFVGHNLPLFLALAAFVMLCRRRPTPEVVFAGCWCGATWLIYALTSTNYSGQCCGVRWFVPLLAPAYFALAISLRDRPEFQGDLLVLSAWGGVLMTIASWFGPWIRHLVPGFWAIQGLALVSWVIWRLQRRRFGNQVIPLSRQSDSTLAKVA